jgi:prepilin-type N-terminal cleavage/methylation domain-containing protein
MKDKKGFTLIELLAVIILIGVLSVLVVPNVIDSINKSDQKLFVLQEQEVEDAAKIYIEDYCLSPIEDSYVCPLSHTIFSGELLYSGEIDLNVLVANNYIDEVSLKGKSCIGSVVVTNNKPDALLACGEKFISEGILNYKLMAFILLMIFRSQQLI